MGKKQKDETPNVNTAANKDIIQRLNFLYQASVYLQSLDIVDQSRHLHGSANSETATLERDTRPKETADKKYKSKTKRTKRRKTTSDLSRDYIHCMRQVAQKTTVKIDPSLKRSLCFLCNSALVPGVSVSVRVEDSARLSHIEYTCLNCKAMRRIPWIAEDPVGSAAPDSSAHDTTDHAEGEESHQQDGVKKSTNRRLPLFARPDAGHVIFRGNDRFSLDEVGCVPFV